MHEAGGESHAAELGMRLERLQTQLDAQREELSVLRAALWRLQQGVAPSRIVQRPQEPAANAILAAPPPAVAQAPAPASTLQRENLTPPTPDPELPPAYARPDPAQPDTVDARPKAQRSLENRIGSQWFSRIAILALLIGVALFLKLAYDNHWIHTTPMGRITAGLLVGAGIVVWSERFRRKGFDAFSYSLKAVGTGTLYLSLWASFQIYHLLPASVALIAMIGVTAWNAIMALAQDSELLAVYALVGGFATPALLGSGGNHAIFLFSYVLAIDVAVLLLLGSKPWQRLLLGCFPGTMIYFIGWYVKFFSADQAGITGLFVILLAAPFVAVALVGKQREHVAEGVLTPLAAASFLSLALYSVLQDSGHHAWLPWAAVALAAVYLLLMRIRRSGIAEAVHLALAVIFLTIAIPLKAEGRWITIGWLAEGVALLWVAAKLFGPEVQPRVRALMRWLGCGALALGVVESLIFWAQQNAQTSFWNGRFATEISAVAALALAAWLARNPSHAADPAVESSAPGWPLISMVCTLASHLIAPLAVVRELSAFWSTGVPEDAAYRQELNTFSIASFLMVYGACLIAWVALRDRENAIPGQRATLRILGCIYLTFGMLGMIVTPIVGDGGPVKILWNARLFLELLGAAALGATAWLAWRVYRVRKITNEGWAHTAAASLVSFNLLLVLTGVHEILTYFGVSATGDAGLAEAFTTSAWLMLYAAALLTAGFWKRMAFVRWQGLGLLVFTIGKVFLYDMRSLGSGYRVLSFIVLGALLLAVSFAYQKDWLKLREDDATEASNPTEVPQ